MKTSPTVLSLVLTSSLALLPAPGRTQDNVEIPKSRLEELERKEKELERLKGDLNKTTDENRQLKKQKEEAVKTSSIEPLTKPVVTHTSPPLASLPQIQADSVIESMDLADYYHSDPAAAEQRFRHQKFSVRGEIVGFEKPLFRRNYEILLRTPGGDTRVICDFLPPEKANAVFSADHGSQLVAMYGENRAVLARVGDTVQVKGECHGLSGHNVMIYAWQISPAR